MISTGVSFDNWHWSPNAKLEGEDWLPMNLSELFTPLLLVGLFCSIALPLTLGELLMSPDNHIVKKYSLVFSGLLACLYVTGLNFFIFTILTMTNDFDIDWELAGRRILRAYAILGYGGAMSYLFLIGCLVKYFGIFLIIDLESHQSRKYLNERNFHPLSAPSPTLLLPTFL